MNDIIESLRESGRLSTALALVLGHEIDHGATSAIQCIEPNRHKHGDTNPSAIVKPTVGRVDCACGLKLGLLELGVRTGFGATKSDVAKKLEAWLAGTECGLSRPAGNGSSRPPRRPADPNPDSIHPYFDEEHEPIYAVLRYDRGPGNKICLPCLPDGAGWWHTGKGILNGVRRVPYRLPDILKADFVVWTEGERKADAVVEELGLPASTSGSSTSWRSEFARYFSGKRVLVLPDEDDPGLKHARTVANDMARVARKVRLLRLPGLGEGEDVHDWILRGGSREQLLELARKAHAYVATDTDGESPERATPAERQCNAGPPWKPAPADLSHDSLALAMAERWGDARYVAAWKRWFFWTGVLWKVDEKLEHLTRARDYLRFRAEQLLQSAEDMEHGLQAGPAALDHSEDDPAGDQEEPPGPPVQDATGRTDAAKAEAEKKDTKKKASNFRHSATVLRSATTVAAVVSLARSNSGIAASVEQWDSDPWLLGTPGGTIDLRTGILRAARVEDYITKSTACEPAAPGTVSPLWKSFLATITDGRPDLEDYLQRFAGYCLTGSTREHAFAFGYGTDQNGKNVLLDTLAGVLGDYAIAIPPEMLMTSIGDRHPTELARLRGARLAIGTETEEGRQWAEARIKALTGDARIVARFMKRDFFEFTPQFKLIIVGNHAPTLRSVDKAIRRRLHFVPFDVRIPDDQVDKDLPLKLEAERPAILRWMLDGCDAWREQGLAPPPVVTAATERYLIEEDSTALWMAGVGTLDPKAWQSSGELWTSWRTWAADAGEEAGTKKGLAKRLVEHGLRPARLGDGTRGYHGLRLQSDPSDREVRHDD